MREQLVPEPVRTKLFGQMYNSIAARLETGNPYGAQERVWEFNIVAVEQVPEHLRNDTLTLLQEVIAEVNQDYLHDSPDRDMTLDKSRLLKEPLTMKVH